MFSIIIAITFLLFDLELPFLSVVRRRTLVPLDRGVGHGGEGRGKVGVLVSSGNFSSQTESGLV